jgi:hypothetical protein
VAGDFNRLQALSTHHLDPLKRLLDIWYSVDRPGFVQGDDELPMSDRTTFEHIPSQDGNGRVSSGPSVPFVSLRASKTRHPTFRYLAT